MLSSLQSAEKNDVAISVVIPALNERESLPELIKRISDTIDARGVDYEIIVVDDGSTDGSFEMLREMGQKNHRLRAIRHFRNHGKSLALMNGFQVASGDILLTMDADLQDIPEMIPRFLDQIDAGYDFVNGWRANRQDRFLKRFVSKLFNRFAEWVFGTRASDINCGFKAYRRPVYKNLELHGDLHRLIPVIVSSSGFKCTEVAIEHGERKFGDSRYKLVRHRGVLDIIALMMVRATQIRPFHIFCEAAFMMFCLMSFFTALWLVCHLYYNDGSALADISRSIFGVLAVWALFLASVLPLFGFLLEMQARSFQRNEWRSQLVKETHPEGLL